MKKTLLGFTIVLLLMISEILILNNDISSLKASNKILQEDLKDKKNISTLKEEKEDLNTSVSNLLAVSTFSDEDIEEIMTSEKTILKDQATYNSCPKALQNYLKPYKNRPLCWFPDNDNNSMYALREQFKQEVFS